VSCHAHTRHAHARCISTARGLSGRLGVPALPLVTSARPLPAQELRGSDISAAASCAFHRRRRRRHRRHGRDHCCHCVSECIIVRRACSWGTGGVGWWRLPALPVGRGRGGHRGDDLVGARVVDTRQTTALGAGVDGDGHTRLPPPVTVRCLACDTNYRRDCLLLPLLTRRHSASPHAHASPPGVPLPTHAYSFAPLLSLTATTT